MTSAIRCCCIALATFVRQIQFSRLGCIRVNPFIVFLITPNDCRNQLKLITLSSSSNLFLTSNCCVINRASRPPEPALCFFGSTLSGAVESNNSVSCSVIVFSVSLYWNLDLVPPQWLSLYVSEELMVSPSSVNFHLSSQIIHSPPLLYFSTCNMSYPLSVLWTTCSLLFPIPPPFPPLSQLSPVSYLSTWNTPFCLPSL